MANTFQIKYLWEIFPDTDFTEEYIVCEEMVEKEPSSENQITEDKWGDIRDSTNRNRIIQSIVLREYEVKFIVSRNVTPAILGYTEYLTITTTENETFQVYDVGITYNKQVNGRNYIIELTFKRADNNIISHLSSDNVLSYKTATSDKVNEIGVTVNNPPIAFTHGTINALGTGGSEYYQFDVPNTNPKFDLLTEIVTLNDYFYIHCNNFDLVSKDIYSCQITFISSDYIRIKTNTTASSLSINHDPKAFILDLEPDFQSDVNVKDIDFSYIIYTFIKPLSDPSVQPIEGINPTDDIQENQRVNAKDVYKFKVWLKTDELWKIEYLNYALAEDITYTEEGTTTNIIKPSQVKDIYSKKENRALIELFEFDIEFMFNSKVVNIFR
jgi:hypothetical protein